MVTSECERWPNQMQYIGLPGIKLIQFILINANYW